MTTGYAEPGERRRQLIALCQEMFRQRRLILASNRGPVEYHLAKDGGLTFQRGRGGLVTALSGISQYTRLTWIACAMSEGDRQAASESPGRPVPSPLPQQKLLVRFVVPSQAAYHQYYSVISNPLLWFLQHYMWNTPYTPNVDQATYDAWETGYVAVNRLFADAVVAAAQEEKLPPFVMLQDYQLYLAARDIRERCPKAILQHFTHIPWPSPAYWQLLPMSMRRAVCEAMCANDLVGLQTMAYVRNFLSTIQEVLPEAEVDYRLCTVWRNGRLTTVRPYPISVDVAGLNRTTRSRAVGEYVEKLRPLCGELTIVRVDRLDPSKNILRGFRAFDQLLARYPELHGRLKFLAFLVPSRTHVPEYRQYDEEVTALIDDINQRYGREGWKPIELFYENNYLQALAGMSLYDVLLVNPVADGMNLVAKEGPTVNSRDGVLVLSDGAGAYEQLRSAALGVAAADLEGTCQALYQALTMPAAERRARAEALRASIARHDLERWLYHQLDDLHRLA